MYNIFIIKGFRTIVFIFMELWTTSFIESMGFTCTEFLGLINLLFLLNKNYYYYVWFFTSAQIQIFFFFFLLQASNNTGILNTCTQLWLMESEQATPVDSIKDVVRSSMNVLSSKNTWRRLENILAETLWKKQ